MKALLLLFFMSSFACARVTLDLDENIVVLAAKDSKLSLFSKSLTLPDGEQKLVIKFDSSVNPESVNQGKGRMTSAPYIFTFNYSGREKLILTTPKVIDEKEVIDQARNPQFMLKANDTTIPFTMEKVFPESINIFSDFRSFLTEDRNQIDGIKQDSTDNLDQVKSAYLGLPDKQKLSFMKWLLNN